MLHISTTLRSVTCRRSLLVVFHRQLRNPGGVVGVVHTQLCWSSTLPYHLVVGLPALSPTMSTGSLAEWYVAEGDSFSAGDAIAKIETDKATIDFEAQDDGFVAKLLASPGKEYTVGEPIMVTVEDRDDVPSFRDFAVTTATTKDTEPTPPATSTPVSPPPTPAIVSPPPASNSPPTPPPPSTPTTNTASKASSVVVATPSPPPTATSPPVPSAPPIAGAGLYSVAWGFTAQMTSPLSKSLATKQKAFIAKYGSTGQKPIA